MRRRRRDTSSLPDPSTSARLRLDITPDDESVAWASVRERHPRDSSVIAGTPSTSMSAQRLHADHHERKGTAEEDPRKGLNPARMVSSRMRVSRRREDDVDRDRHSDEGGRQPSPRDARNSRHTRSIGSPAKTLNPWLGQRPGTSPERLCLKAVVRVEQWPDALFVHDDDRPLRLTFLYDPSGVHQRSHDGDHRRLFDREQADRTGRMLVPGVHAATVYPDRAAQDSAALPGSKRRAAWASVRE